VQQKRTFRKSAAKTQQKRTFRKSAAKKTTFIGEAIIKSA
jgi:hypothetical protein